MIQTTKINDVIMMALFYPLHTINIFSFFSGYISMNNLNDPPNWNIRPNSRADGGDGSRWNYALLVPMLGLAAFRKS